MIATTDDFSIKSLLAEAKAQEAFEINISSAQVPDISRRAIAALAAKNMPPHLFRHGNGLARIVWDDNYEARLVSLSIVHMCWELSNVATWKRGRRGVPPPKYVAEHILATPDLPFLAIRGIARAPFFSEKGVLVIEQGYDFGSEIYLDYDEGLDIPEIPNKPTTGEIEDAVHTINDLFGDFPFEGPADRAHAFAVLLLPFCREMIGGPTPLHLVNAPTVGNGKSLLSEVALIPGCGKVYPTTLGGNDEETRKKITSSLMAGRSSVFFDNVQTKFDSAALAGALTGTDWEDRVLGGNTLIQVANRAIWIATANNPQLSHEIARRSVSIRIDAGVEKPFERGSFRHSDLRGFTRARRGQLIGAALTIIQGWISAGRPTGKRLLGSFEAWSRILGGILTIAKVDGFLGNTERLFEAADAEDGALRMLVNLWFDKFGSDAVPATRLVPLLNGLSVDVGDKGSKSQATRLGIFLGKHRGRVFGSHRIESVRERKGTAWRLGRQDVESSDGLVG